MADGPLSEPLTQICDIQVLGSPRLVRSLLREGLLDELSLGICPFVVGQRMRRSDETADSRNSQACGVPDIRQWRAVCDLPAGEVVARPGWVPTR